MEKKPMCGTLSPNPSQKAEVLDCFTHSHTESSFWAIWKKQNEDGSSISYEMDIRKGSKLLTVPYRNSV
jgi:hypothetical protein